MNKVIFFDTTLRDGEQSPGNTMFDWEKVEIASALCRAGVDVIEAGFPAASHGDFLSVRKVAEELISEHKENSSVIAGLATVRPESIKSAAEALAPAISIGKGRIHTFVSSSENHAQNKLRKSQSEILDMARNGVQLARSFTPDVEFSPEDASRTGIDFLLAISEMAASEGARTINIPDTVGYAVPEEFGELISKVVQRVTPYGAVVSAHCHNDLGRAVDNSLAALINGARQVEVAINGIGERAGNTSLEQIAMNLAVRRDYYEKKNLSTNIDNRMLGELSRLVAMATGSWPAPNTPIIGASAFSHQAGIHQDGVSKSLNTYEIMSPQDVGWVGERYIIGKHSGKSGVAQVLHELGYSSDQLDTEQFRARVKKVADEQKHVFDNDVRKIAAEFGLKPRCPIIEFDMENVVYTRVVSPAVKMNLTWNDVAKIVDGSGEGPVHAAYTAIKRYSGNGIKLVSFKINAVGRGEKAMAESRVTIERDGRFYVARGGHNDLVVSAISAYVNAINRSLVANAN